VVVHAVLHREYAVLVLAGRVDELYDVVLRFDTLDLREGCNGNYRSLRLAFKASTAMVASWLLGNPDGMGHLLFSMVGS